MRPALHAPRATLAGALLLLLTGLAGGLGWIGTPRLLLATWLAAWWCCAGLVMGGCLNLWLHALTGGRWGAVLRPAGALLSARRIWLGPLFLPLAFGLPLLYPWAAPAADAFGALDQPAFARVWLSLPAFALRCAGYGLLWYWLAGSARQPAIGRGRAAASLIAYGLTGSLAAVDLLMSLTIGWRSTGFALLVLMSQALGGAAALVLWTAWRSPAGLRPAGAHDAPVARDLGNLLLMYVLMWGYLAFMQFLIIWAENLPHEIAWFVPRLQTGWWNVGVALVVLQLALPLALLVLRAVKDRPVRLGAVAALVLAAHALDTVWLVAPSVDAHTLAFWWLAPLCLTGMALLLFAPMAAARACGETAPAAQETRSARA